MCNIVETVSKKNNYLTDFGYLPMDMYIPGQPDSRNITDGLINLQMYAGLPPTGELDFSTIDLLNTPRCGNADVLEFRISFNMWSKLDLAYIISTYHGGLPIDEQRRVIRKAWDLWADNSALSFHEVTSLEDADIVINFFSGDHQDGSPFDYEGGVLGHAFRPETGWVHFDDDERWSIGHPPRFDYVDLFIIAAHEFGHTLGLVHSNVYDSLSYVPILQGLRGRLQTYMNDVMGIQFMYGENQETVPPTTVATKPPTTPTTPDLPTTTTAAITSPTTSTPTVPTRTETMESTATSATNVIPPSFSLLTTRIPASATTSLPRTNESDNSTSSTSSSPSPPSTKTPVTEHKTSAVATTNLPSTNPTENPAANRSSTTTTSTSASPNILGTMKPPITGTTMHNTPEVATINLQRTNPTENPAANVSSTMTASTSASPTTSGTRKPVITGTAAHKTSAITITNPLKYVSTTLLSTTSSTSAATEPDTSVSKVTRPGLLSTLMSSTPDASTKAAAPVAGKGRRRPDRPIRPILALAIMSACPRRIDAVVSDRESSFTYIFADSNVWHKERDTDTLRNVVLPAELPLRPDAAMYFAFSIYIFKGCNVWRSNQRTERIKRSTISQLWMDLPCDIQAAYRSNDDGFIYFFKDNLVYNYLGYQHVDGPVTMSSLGWRGTPNPPAKIDAVYKMPNNRVNFINGNQYYTFNDNGKYVVRTDGHLLNNVVPDLLPDCLNGRTL